MKRLLFIDNDSKKADEVFGDLDRVKDFLEEVGIFQMFNNEITPLYEFPNGNNIDEVYKLLFNKENIICTWSVYSAGFPHSLQQLFSYLGSAGRNEITNQIYIDCSGMILTALSRNLKEQKQVYAILQAIETNHILTNVDRRAKRLRVELKGYYESPFKLEDVHISLLKY